jgi:hypothetical protein
VLETTSHGAQGITLSGYKLPGRIGPGQFGQQGVSPMDDKTKENDRQQGGGQQGGGQKGGQKGGQQGGQGGQKS